MYYLSVGAIFKNESMILEEWLNHYINMGVDHFYLVNNGSDDDYQDILSKYKEKITLYNLSISHCQIKAYNEHILPDARKETRWLMIVDIDEFMYSPTTKSSIASVLQNYHTVGGIVVPWIFFGSNGFDLQPKSLVRHFTNRRNYGDGITVNLKTIYQTRFVRSIGPHSGEFIENKYSVDPRYNKRHNGNFIKVSEKDMALFPLLINHYAVQSKEYFNKIKMIRGDVLNPENDYIRDWTYFNEHDFNEIEDLRLSAATFGVFFSQAHRKPY